ncbi:C40 family peptidase [Paenibacillus spongiae]|uniref:C40 family peptidase n=1 Tax=Paenibacillus spongiae TaxID=2909671 RepID=A0ABY5S4V1_9BACL|nr:C40 family peptidase [Paenibacillus spongiae]UVI28926.1 C40 family peptidase [Paenibacillus spongiae]
MKKAFISLVAGVMIFAGGGSVFAAQTPLNESIDQVIGTPYKWGGTTEKGFDCSGFIIYIFDQFKVDLPRTSSSQAETGTEVSQDELREGDLVFFNTSGKGVSHAGIYVGDGKFAHSSSSKGVVISKLSDSYYKERYVTARRVVSSETYASVMKSE